MQNLKIPKYGVLHHASAENAIEDIAGEVRAVGADAPENHHMIITMRTPDGRVMLVNLIRPIGFSSFLAEGFIDELPCKMIGHISTLSIFMAYEEGRAGKERPGFVIQTSKATESLPESES